MTKEIACMMVDCNAVPILMELYKKTHEQIYISVFLKMIGFTGSRKISVASLFQLCQLSPHLYDLSFTLLEDQSKSPSEPKQDIEFA